MLVFLCASRIQSSHIVRLSVSKSSITALSKSPNKHNRLYMIAEPLGEEVAKAIEDGKINPRDDFKTRARVLADELRLGCYRCPKDLVLRSRYQRGQLVSRPDQSRPVSQ